MIGRRVAADLALLGFAVMAWSRTAKPALQGRGFDGAAGLDAMLGQEILVNLLPLTPETKGILNRKTFARMYRGGYLIQVGRGEHLVEADLLAALESGRLAGAALDVFTTEPLPPRHPFWRHPNIVVTPHDACEVSVEAIGATFRATAEAIRAGRRRTPSTANAATERHHGYSSAGLVACDFAAHPIDTLRAASAVPEALAQRLAAEHYGLIAAVHRLDSERDQNFRLRSLSGREYVLKIANPAEDRAVTNLQTEALLHLAAADPGLPVPRIFPARNGMTELDVTFDDGSTRVVRLLSYLAGTPMHAAEGRPCCGVNSAAAPQRSRGVFPISAIAAITNCCGTFSTPPNCGR